MKKIHLLNTTNKNILLHELSLSRRIDVVTYAAYTKSTLKKLVGLIIELKSKMIRSLNLDLQKKFNSLLSEKFTGRIR